MRISLFLLCISLLGCHQIAPPTNDSVHPRKITAVMGYEVPDRWVDYDSLVLHRSEGIWTLHEEPYSGYAVLYYPNGNLKSKMGFLSGKKEGEAWEYYPNGFLRQNTPYHQNQVHGEVKNWFGTVGNPLLAVRNYHLGKPHGEHRKWYKSGQVFKIMNYHMGREEGMQQAYNENGSLYANYEARNGRSFGLKRSMLCYELEDEKIK